MSPVSSEQIAKLRARTGVGILAVKKALEESGGDEEKAIELLRKSGEAQAVKKADREQSEGGIFSASGKGKAVLVAVKCETDFVGRSENFIKLGQSLADAYLTNGQSGLDALVKEKVPAAVLEFGENISLGETGEIDAPTTGSYVHSNRKIGVLVGTDKGTAEQATDAAMHAAAMNPEFISPDQVSTDAVAKEKEIWREQLAKEGKPAEMIEKIMTGKEKKFREESALLTQPFVKDPAKTVGAMMAPATVTAYVRLTM